MISRRAALSMFGRAALSFAAGVTLAASDAEARGPGSPHPYATMLGRGRVRAAARGQTTSGDIGAASDRRI